MEDRDLLAARLRELSNRTYQRDIPQHTDFLGTSEQAVFHETERELAPVPFVLYGGHAEADRQMALFLPAYLSEEAALGKKSAAGGNREDEAGDAGAAEQNRRLAELFSEYLACIRIRARSEKFADALTHRDYLGALMNLGIERDQTGDILVDGTEAWIFCTTGVAGLITDELTRVRHTAVECERVSPAECSLFPKFEAMSVNVASERLDALVSAVFKLSRGVSAELIAAEKVFADGRILRQSGASLKEGMRISVRGYGKFIYDGMEHETKKGRLYVKVRKFV
ncbi:MAG: YlmH/Sll1252 family protein [Eubacteriales bacterium]|nr:YlmH/Sll1252 family protein [Eubacteriales bacterium]